MKNKYPKYWIETVGKCLRRSFELGRADNVIRTHTESDPLMNVAYTMAEMEAVGMLREVPEPLEIEYCTSHQGAGRTPINCPQQVFSLHGSKCTFVKMREVEE